METTVLDYLSVDTLTSILKSRGQEIESEPSVESCVSILLPEIQEEGIKQFVKLLRKMDLKGWTKKIDKKILTSQNQNSTSNAQVLRKRLGEQMMQKGIHGYIKKVDPSREILKDALKRFVCNGSISLFSN